MTAKTIRFYETREADKEALAILGAYRSFGCTSENALIIKALLLLEENKEEDLAEKIAKKVLEGMETISIRKEESKEEPKENHSDTFLKACAFMDGL